MKRDMELVRAILIELEQCPDQGDCHEIHIPDHTDDEISSHVELMQEAGLVEAIDFSSFDGKCWKPQRLTWDGHEFLDAVRSDTVWAKAKDKVMSTTGTLTLEALKVALSTVVRQAVTSGM